MSDIFGSLAPDGMGGEDYLKRLGDITRLQPELLSMSPFGSLAPYPVGNMGFVGGAGSVRPGSAAKPKPVSVGGVKAYHSTYEPFDEFDFSRLGKVTRENVGGMSNEDYAMNLARIGAWASDKSVSDQMGAKVTLPVDIGGKGKQFPSLDNLEAAVRRAGGPEKFRAKMLGDGYGHVQVKDEEFGTNSFVGLAPDFFKIEGR